MSDRVVIRGIGLVTPLGVGVGATWDRLLAGDFIATHARSPLALPTAGGGPSSPKAHPTSRVSALAEAAAAECVASAAGWTRAAVADPRTALVVATSRGPADDWADADLTAPPSHRPATSNNDPKDAGGRSEVLSYPAGPSFGLSDIAIAVARRLGHGLGPRLTLSAACAGGLHALIRAAMLIEHGDADRAVVVAAESSLHRMFVESFRRLGVLAPPGERCRPFDLDRSGFLCAEAAAAVVLERSDGPLARTGSQADDGGDEVWLDRYAFAGDASHLTGSDPTGATLRRLLARAADGRPVDVIHAHGTGTEANDAAEAAAIDAVWDEMPAFDHVYPSRIGFGSDESDAPVGPTTRRRQRPAVYSHKGAIGHTVGAAGLVSVVLNVLMHRHGVVPPNVGVRTPIELRHAEVHRGTVERPIRRSVAVAAGFGGATAAVSLASSGRA